MKPEAKSFVVQKITQELADVRSYTFHFGLMRFQFEPGQFVVASLDSKGIDAQGALTLSSSPLHPTAFELTVKRSGGFGTTFYDTVEEGDIISIGSAKGPFMLPREGTQPVCFISRDYCIPAARSYYRFLTDTKATRPFLLLHEITNPTQILYHQEFTRPAWNGFARLIFLDSPTKPANWTGPHTRITRSIIQRIIKRPDDTLFFITGEGPVIKYYKEQFEGLNLPPRNIHYERWS
ncbi:MAG TPA: FAD-dependent oxidoreductase [Acidobacteriota bacterium]|nr:FAD-dependent oxidoreductase [Acidobacteriota bacterium]